MNTRLNLLALAVVLAGAGTLVGPSSASATYINPLDPPKEYGSGVVYCCSTGNTARCCFESGCWTKDGFCLRLG